MPKKLTILKALLYAGSLYYLVGAVCHFFGLTLFPVHDGRLYAQYQDTLIALSAIVLSLILFTVARNPVKNEDVLKVIIVGGLIAIIFGIGIIFKINFNELGAPDKHLQVIVEVILLVIFTGSLILLRPKK
ncbi:MAG: hypothetical protein WCT36_04955 [Candidatus Gracilibacteria bacterium]